jgi:hypothetical protein
VLRAGAWGQRGDGSSAASEPALSQPKASWPTFKPPCCSLAWCLSPPSCSKAAFCWEDWPSWAWEAVRWQTPDARRFLPVGAACPAAACCRPAGVLCGRSRNALAAQHLPAVQSPQQHSPCLHSTLLSHVSPSPTLTPRPLQRRCRMLRCSCRRCWWAAGAASSPPRSTACRWATSTADEQCW